MKLYILDAETYFDREYNLRRMDPASYILDPRFELIRARSPANVEWEAAAVTARLHFWEVERELGDPVATRVARWEYDTAHLTFANRVAAAYPGSKVWE